MFFSICLNVWADDYKYPRDPYKFIEQIEKEYPDELERVKQLNAILFDIYHYVSTFAEDKFFVVTNDYLKSLIDKTVQNSLLPYYYYMRGTIKYHQYDSDSSLIFYKKSLELAEKYKIYDIEVHSIITLGVQNMIASDSLVKYFSNYLKLGFEKALSSNDNFAKAAGAWSMIEYHAKNTNSTDSVLHYRNLSYSYINQIPIERLPLRNFAIMMTENLSIMHFSNLKDITSKKMEFDFIENIRKAVDSKFEQKLIDFDEFLNLQLASYYARANKIDSGIYLASINYDKLKKSDELPYLKLSYCELLASLYQKKGDYKNALEYFQESKRLQNQFIDKNESIKRIAKLRELENTNYQEKMEAEETQRLLTYSIILIILLFAGVIFFIILNRYKKIQLLNGKLDEANSTKNKLFRIISHDLNNPVNSTIMLSEQLVAYGDRMDTEDLIKNSEGILQSGKHLKGLLESLIEWSKVNLEGMKKRVGKVKVNELFNSIFEDIETNVKWKKIKIESSIVNNLEIEFDRDALRVVLRNILTNSIKFCKEGGKIIIHANSNEIIIEDDGIGFLPEQLSGNFVDNNSRAGTKNEKGLGLGLQIVTDICNMYNTKVEISNRKEGGGRVSLKFN